MAVAMPLKAERDGIRARPARESAPAVPLPTRRLALSLYFVSALFILTAVVDAVANTLPLQPSLVTWRYGAVGALANYLISPVFGALLATATAFVLHHGRTLRVLGVLWAITALAMLALAVGFSLDVIQLRAMIPPDQLSPYQVGAAKALAKYGLTAVAFALMAATALQKRAR